MSQTKRRLNQWGDSWRMRLINPIIQPVIDLMSSYPIDSIALARFKSMDDPVGWDANGSPVEEELKDEF